jgi:hypothetical protein
MRVIRRCVETRFYHPRWRGASGLSLKQSLSCRLGIYLNTRSYAEMGA